jgi:hypothetical protein
VHVRPLFLASPTHMGDGLGGSVWLGVRLELDVDSVGGVGLKDDARAGLGGWSKDRRMHVCCCFCTYDVCIYACCVCRDR